MPTGKELNQDAKKRAAAAVQINSGHLDDALDFLQTSHVEQNIPVPPDPTPDKLEADETAESYGGGSEAFKSLQLEMAQIREARAKLSKDMEAPELDRDERDTLKARGSLLDSRERSVREELKMFHKDELSDLGKVNKIRVIIEDYLTGTEGISPRLTEGAL